MKEETALLFAHQDIVEARAGKATEHRRTGAQSSIIGVRQAGDNPVAVDARGRNLVFQHNLFGRLKRRNRRVDRGDVASTRHITEPFLHQRLCLRRIHITGEDQHRIVGAIIVFEPLFEIM